MDSSNIPTLQSSNLQNSPKRILITGGSGFFGSILKEELLKLGYTCVSIDLQQDTYQHKHFTSIQGDIRDINLLDNVFGKYKFDAVFHCAALLAHVKKDLKNLWTSNVDGTKNIADMCCKYGINKIVFISSNCLWAKNFDMPVKETEIPEPVEIYGKSKLEGEKILMSYKNKDLKTVIFRSPTIMDEGRLGLLGILFEFIDENRKLWMVGDGNNKYQFVYAKDLVAACIKALDYNKSDIFNIGSDNVKTFNEVYRYVIDKVNSKSKLVHLPKWFMILGMKICYMLGISPLGPYQYKMIAENFVFDTNHIKKELGFIPTKTNEEMLLVAYEYFHKNKKEIHSRTAVSAHKSVAKMGIIRIIKFFS
ncbi:MAG: NAD(P)-dependent oxidoreductase [Elusimicrobia bacterium]|nr:NAD(P)-dependent oxidoreductase [Elusimicrobiota bacterium]